MIIARYLSTKILYSTLGVALVLSLVVMSGRMARYISAAAEGQLAVSLVFPVVFFRMPQLLEIILPVSLLLGIMLSIGERYENNEMTVVQATGISQGRIVLIGMTAAFFVAVVVAMLTFYVSPKGNSYVGTLVNTQGLKSELSSLAPNTFYELKNRGGTVYAGVVDAERMGMERVFVFRSGSVREEHATPNPFDRVRQTIIYAAKGYQEFRDDGGFYFVLENGVQFEGEPGASDFVVTEFEKYSQKIERPDETVNVVTTTSESALLTQLLGKTDADSIAELHWRLSLPISVLILATIGISLSRSNPRQGRYHLLIPALVLFLFYIALLNIGREAVAESGSSALTDIWLVHLGFAALAGGLHFWPALRLAQMRWKR